MRGKMPGSSGMGGNGGMMSGPAALIMEMAPAAEAPGEKKSTSNFDLAADRVFQALGGEGDSVAFRAALRSAIKTVINDMRL